MIEGIHELDVEPRGYPLGDLRPLRQSEIYVPSEETANCAQAKTPIVKRRIAELRLDGVRIAEGIRHASW